jgi:HAD superfamily hydrolase (TIGR01509 family)
VDRIAVQNLSLERHAQIMEGKNILPGVEDYLKAAKSLGLKIGLASSSSLDWVEKYLKQFTLFDYFDCIYTRDDVKNVKPDPELYEKALQFFNISGDEAIAFEDSPNGLRAAKTAGLCCVAIPNEITAKLDFNSENYDIMLSSMVEKDVRDLLLIFNKGR